MLAVSRKESNVEEDDVESFASDGDFLKLQNPYIKRMDRDFLYHLGLDTVNYKLAEMFGDVKFVCMGGTKERMQVFTKYIVEQFEYMPPTGTTIYDITQHSTRYSMYKVGPILCVSHGMGVSSISIVLHEIIKLLYHAKVSDPILFKLGTSGGFGKEKGTVVITTNVVNARLGNYYEVCILGQLVRRPAILDINLARELKQFADPGNTYETILGKTMCTSDFYEEQGRTDGAICEYTQDEGKEYVKHLRKEGVDNIEMQSIPFAAITHRAGIKAAVVCVTLIDKLELEEISTTREDTDIWQMRPIELIVRYIKHYFENNMLSIEGHGSIDNPLI